MGTDAGASPERFVGYFEHLEMAMMVEAGLTPAQVLRAATVDAARAMRVERRGDPGARRMGRPVGAETGSAARHSQHSSDRRRLDRRQRRRAPGGCRDDA